eukprot:ANDGO_00141.mRNA.1 hypothetical protein
MSGDNALISRLLLTPEEYGTFRETNKNVFPDLIGVQDPTRHAHLPGVIPVLPQPASTRLQSEGYTLSNGASFGCDILGYPGDPLLFHSKLEVHAVQPSEQWSVADLLCAERVASAVKKVAVLAVKHEDASIQFLQLRRFQWEGSELPEQSA